MTIIDDLTPVYYRLMRFGAEQQGTDVVLLWDLDVLNAEGSILATVHPSTTLTTQEKQYLAGFVDRKAAAFEAATGLTKYVEPEEPE